LKAKRQGYLAAYAQHAGITRESAAKQLQRAGVNYAKPFDFKEADRLIAAGRHPSRGKYAKRKLLPVSPNGTRANGTVSFLEAQRRKEVAKAEEAELRVRKMAGELIEVEQVKQAMFERGRQVGMHSSRIRTGSLVPLAAETIRQKYIPC